MSNTVMAGEPPMPPAATVASAIHVLSYPRRKQVVDTRHKAGPVENAGGSIHDRFQKSFADQRELADTQRRVKVSQERGLRLGGARFAPRA